MKGQNPELVKRTAHQPSVCMIKDKNGRDCDKKLHATDGLFRETAVKTWS